MYAINEQDIVFDVNIFPRNPNHSIQVKQNNFTSMSVTGFPLFTGVSVEKAKPLSNRLEQSQYKLMETRLMLQVKAVKELLHPFNQDVRQEAPLSLGLQIKHPGSPSRWLFTNAGIHLQKLDKLTRMCHNKVQTTNSESQLRMHHLVY